MLTAYNTYTYLMNILIATVAPKEGKYAHALEFFFFRFFSTNYGLRFLFYKHCTSSVYFYLTYAGKTV